MERQVELSAGLDRGTAARLPWFKSDRVKILPFLVSGYNVWKAGGGKRAMEDPANHSQSLTKADSQWVQALTRVFDDEGEKPIPPQASLPCTACTAARAPSLRPAPPHAPALLTLTYQHRSPCAAGVGAACGQHWAGRCAPHHHRFPQGHRRHLPVQVRARRAWQGAATMSWSGRLAVPDAPLPTHLPPFTTAPIPSRLQPGDAHAHPGDEHGPGEGHYEADGLADGRP